MPFGFLREISRCKTAACVMGLLMGKGFRRGNVGICTEGEVMNRENRQAWGSWVQGTIVAGVFLGGVLGGAQELLAQAASCGAANTPLLDINNNNNDQVYQLGDGEAHFFRVRTPSNGVLTVFTEGDTNTRGRLYDADCVPIINYVDFGGARSNFYFSVGGNSTEPAQLAAGLYYVEVRGSSDSGPYRLRILGDFANDDHGADFASATVVSGPSTQGNLSLEEDRDFFEFKYLQEKIH